MVPGNIHRVHALTFDCDSRFIEADTVPVGRLLILADFVGPELVAKRLGIGRYLFEFVVPHGYDIGTKVYFYKSASVQGEEVNLLEELGAIENHEPVALKKHIDHINNALKQLSLDSIPWTKDLE